MRMISLLSRVLAKAIHRLHASQQNCLIIISLQLGLRLVLLTVVGRRDEELLSLVNSD